VQNTFTNIATEKKMRKAVLAEQRSSSQRLGRDAVGQAALLSDLRDTAPFSYFMSRVVYRTEMAFESVWNRIYALFVTVFLLLAVSILLLLLVTFLSYDELKHLGEDAVGYVDDDLNGGDGGSTASMVDVFLYASWITWCFFVDPGSHTEKLDPLRYKWGRMIAAIISLFGIIFFSFVLGFVVELMQSFIARVTEGRSSVIEEGHYLILGYSEKCIAVIGELAIAMDSDGGGVCVVLADYPTKADFDMLVTAHLNTLRLTGKTRVVFRPGSPLMTSMLLKVSPETSRAIIVLSDPRQDADHADAMVLRVILSLKSILGINVGRSREAEGDNALSPSHAQVAATTVKAQAKAKRAGDVRGRDHGRRMSMSLSDPLESIAKNLDALYRGGRDKQKDYNGHIVAELRDNDNKPIIEVSGGSLVELVVVHDIIGRMLAKSTVQPNIRRIYDDLLGFDGCEFYFASHPELTGITFREASLHLIKAVLVGIKRGEDIILNPDSKLPATVSSTHHRKHSGDTAHGGAVLEAGDELILIAEDDSAYLVLDRPMYDDGECRPWPPRHGSVSAMDAVVAAEATILDAHACVEASEQRKRSEVDAMHDAQDAAEEEAVHAAVRASLGEEEGRGGKGGSKQAADRGVARVPAKSKLPPLNTGLNLVESKGGLALTALGGSSFDSTTPSCRPTSRSSVVSFRSSTLSRLELPSRRRHEGYRVLICGWRRDIKDMLTLLDKHLPPGSEVCILSERWVEPKDFEDEYLRDNCPSLKRISVRHSFGRADVRRRLVESKSLGFGSAEKEVDVIVVVADESKEKDMLLSDSQTIASCLLVRDVQADELEHRDVSLADLSRVQLEALQLTCPITAEILDVATRATIDENPAIKALADFVVVNDLAARLIAAVADRREVSSVLGELLGADPKSQDIFVVEAPMLLYEDELVKHRHSACIDVGENAARDPELVRRHAKRAPLASSMLTKHKALLERARALKAAAGGLGEEGHAADASRKISKKHSSASSTRSLFPLSRGKAGEAKAVSFAEMAARASAAPRHGILLGYIKASWNAKEDCVGDLATVFNPQSKGAPLYWHSRDFLIIMSIEDYRTANSNRRFTVVR